ncbi:MAG: CDP-diacylglycerol--glycerol-3-phosphate 3-phosphatidyltransferase [Candidatus Methylopumilus sp.]|nr:CDP-diacylglycerol--glycerol-3-phosphate 3-phosphatidyltransferase [Candidatus Methylopumilus sp.]
MKPNIPTMLTWLRILLIPVFVGAFYWPENLHKLSAMPSHWVNVFATSVFAIAAITDWLDGYLARRLNQTSSFGAFLDPVADKLMVAAALIVLVEFGRVGAIVSLIIIGREIAISALREWMAGEGQRSSVGVAMIGKVKTFVQMAAILFLLYWDDLDLGPLGIFSTKDWGHVLIVAAAILTLLSMAYYLKAAWPKLKGK